MDDKPEVANSSEELVEQVAGEAQEVEGEQADNEFESLFEDEGKEDVEGKGEVENLSLEELNTLAGRKDNPFKSKEDFFKHYKNLNSFVGKKEKPKVKVPEQESEVAILRKELAAEKFYSNNPTAKTYAKVIEAYAKENDMSLSEAWESDEFKPFAESSPKKQIITNNRLNPTTPKIPIDLIEEAKHSDKAQHELVEKWLGK